jgi:hypothetical protein
MPAKVTPEGQQDPSPVIKARSRVGVATRRADPVAIESARRDLAAAKLEAYVAKVVAAAPPLTPEQSRLIAGLLNGGGDAA